MAKNYSHSKGRSSSARFVAIPHAVLNHPDFIKLNHFSIHLLLELMLQFNGNNNGDLSCSPGLLKARGFSAGSLNKAKNELLEMNFIQITRQGGRNKCSLYGVTWLPIDSCGGKIDILPTNKPSRSF